MKESVFSVINVLRSVHLKNRTVKMLVIESSFFHMATGQRPVWKWNFHLGSFLTLGYNNEPLSSTVQYIGKRNLFCIGLWENELAQSAQQFAKTHF